MKRLLLWALVASAFALVGCHDEVIEPEEYPERGNNTGTVNLDDGSDSDDILLNGEQ